MNISIEDRPALILMDIQKAFDDIAYFGGQRNNENAEANAAELLKIWRDNKLPIFHIKHCSSNPNSLQSSIIKG
jgi:nicotinamidase-related amidase